MGNYMKDNIIVGYYQDRAIVQNEDGTLYYFNCPENLIPIGAVADEGLLSLEFMEDEEREEILRRFG